MVAREANCENRKETAVPRGLQFRIEKREELSAKILCCKIRSQTHILVSLKRFPNDGLEQCDKLLVDDPLRALSALAPLLKYEICGAHLQPRFDGAGDSLLHTVDGHVLEPATDLPLVILSPRRG